MTRFVRPLLAVLLLTAGAAVAAGAIVVRHDLDPALYLVDPSEFPAVGRLDGRTESVLIDPHWALTAAHTVDSLSTLDRPFVRFGDRCHAVERIVIHPEWEGGWPRLHSVHDIALLRLGPPVDGIEPVALYTGHGELERVLTIVGRGRSGDGRSGPAPERDDRMRRATSRVDLVTATGLYSVFQDPEDSTELGGTGGAGDSGGPALLDEGGAWRVAGISSASTGVPEVSLSRYGVLDIYTRVSAFVPWIRDVLAERGVGRREWSPPLPPEEAIAGDPMATALIEALDTGSAAAMAAFHRSYGAVSDDPAGWGERVVAAVVEPRGPLVARAAATRGEEELRILFEDADAPGDRFSLTLARGADRSRFERFYMKPERDPALPSRCEEALERVRGAAAPDSSGG